MRSSDELLLVFICGKVHPKRAKLNNRKGMVLKMTKEEIANIRRFLVETFAFTDEQSAAAICAARRPLVRLPAATRRSPTATFIKVFR